MGKQKKTGNSQIPLFIDKLCTILQDESIKEYIDWTSSQDAFNIKDIYRFTDIVLPKYFKHNNFSSFIRQLNMYGFSKVRHEEGENVYQNQNFQRDNRVLLANIKRKIHTNDRDDQVVLYKSSPNTPLARDLTDLKTKQKGLENMCKQLIAQNAKILEQNNRMMKRLSEDRKQKNHKIQQLLVSLIMARGNNNLHLPQSQSSHILSLANSQQPDYSNANLENFRQFLQDTNSMQCLQQALRSFQRDETNKKSLNSATNNNINNKSKSYTIVKQQDNKKQQSIKNEVNEQSIKNDEEHDNSMLSLGDFLNFQQPGNK